MADLGLKGNIKQQKTHHAVVITTYIALLQCIYSDEKGNIQ